METALIYALVALTGYFIGSISPARIIFTKKKPGQEPDRIRTPTTDGQAELVAHNVGSTNVMIAFGARWGLLTMLIDIVKTLVPTLVLRLVFPGAHYHLVCAVAVLVGHLWPVWYKFKGGGGNSCVIGMLLAISPLGMIISHIGGMIIGKWLPMFSFLGGVLLTIPWFAVRDGLFSPETAFAVLISLLYVAGQLPEAIQISKLKRQGHVVDPRHVVRMMKRSASKKNQAPLNPEEPVGPAENDSTATGGQ
jgi:acyl phosphate:glycerol-3-phosphate acyltransferase